MLNSELLKKVRLIELNTRKNINEALTGQYRSHFKGAGVQFSEHRVYVPGDDIRHIDWKVSARTRDPLIRKYDEERELSVFLVVDASASESFGSDSKLKSEMAAELGGMLAFAATMTGDKVGLLLFTDAVEHIVPPKKGRAHVQRMIRDLLTHQPKHRGTHLANALDAAARIMKHGGIVFVLSDFLEHTEEDVLALKRLARKHDVVAVVTSDQRELEIPPVGTFLFVNPETGEESFVDTAAYGFRKWIESHQSEWNERLSSLFKKSQIDFFKANTHEDYADAVVQFFKARARRVRS